MPLESRMDARIEDSAISKGLRLISDARLFVCAIWQVQTYRLIHLQAKPDVFAGAFFIHNLISLVLLGHHFRYCCFST